VIYLNNSGQMKSLFFILFLFPVSLLSQNLVINSDFETKSGCPNASGQFVLADEWFSPNIGTPDYFNDCSSTLEYGTEFNCKGGQIPHSGHGYMGFLSENLHNNEFFEYLETHLSEPFKSDQTYCIKLYVSLGDCDFALDELGAVFSQSILKIPQAKKIVIPFLPLTNGSVLSDTEKWMCIQGIYKAKGGEKYLTIGYFDKEDKFSRVRTNPKNDPTFKSAYYFIDDVSVIRVDDTSSCNCTK
jgi:OmpA-OmpF porin, OOP family